MEDSFLNGTLGQANVFAHLDINKIDLADIQGLIDNKERENQYIEYKEILPDFKNPAQKLEFLHDISAFANAEGGDIIYGIAEKRDNTNLPTAIPVAIPGFQNANPDAIQRHVEGIVSSGLQPSLRGLQFKWLAKDDSNHILILRIPRSWIRPHDVPVNAEFRVSTRTASGKTPLSFREIGDMIIGSNTMVDKVREFRNRRIELLKADELAIQLKPSAVIMHMIPADSFESGNQFSAQLLRETCQKQGCLPLGYKGNMYPGRFNFNGVLDIAKNDPRETYSYVQYFRNGIIESANNYLFFNDNKDTWFESNELENSFINAVKCYLDFQNSLHIIPQIYVLISILGVYVFK